MARVLLIEPDRAARVALEQALERAGITGVSGVSSGSFALTMLERDRPDVVVCRARLPDIDGWELCEIARSDPALTDVRFVLLAAAGDEASAGAIQAADRVLVGGAGPDEVVAEVRSLLADLSAPSADHADDSRGLHGSLAVMDLAEVAQAIGLGAKTGELVVTVGSDEGTLVFDHGRLVHAEFKRLRGEPAFAALIAAAHRQPGWFRFDPQERAVPRGGRTIERSLESLLLSVATDIDEGRAGTPGPRPAP